MTCNKFIREVILNLWTWPVTHLLLALEDVRR